MSAPYGPALWRAVEKSQGFAYISDAVEEMTDAQVMAEAMRALDWHRRCVVALTVFIRARTPKADRPKAGIRKRKTRRTEESTKSNQGEKP